MILIEDLEESFGRSVKNHYCYNTKNVIALVLRITIEDYYLGHARVASRLAKLCVEKTFGLYFHNDQQ